MDIGGDDRDVATRGQELGEGGDVTADLANGPRELGTDPESGKDITLRKGPYGLYLQLGEPEGEGKEADAAEDVGPEADAPSDEDAPEPGADVASQADTEAPDTD